MLAGGPIAAGDKAAFYRELAGQLRALLAGERDPVANAANAAALLFHAVPALNWAGFYVLHPDGTLVLGPFQGRPACVRIPPGRGVCGAAVERACSVLVPDVHDFPGHIACDAASRAELVVPLLAPDGLRGGLHGSLRGGLRGVLDLDSPVPARFDRDDRDGVEQLAAILVAGSDPFRV